MTDVNQLEQQLNEQMNEGLITEFEMRRIMSRATGGVYLDATQKEQYATASEYINETLNTLLTLGVISEKRIESTRRKMERAVVKHLTNGGDFTAEGRPVFGE